MATAVYNAVGRRKESVARVLMKPGKGQILINSRPFKDYICRESLAIVVTQPLDITNQRESYDITVNVNGGGLTGQAGAIRHGISRALVNANEAHKAPLKKAGLLTRDSREKERKKYGLRGARRAFQFSKR